MDPATDIAMSKLQIPSQSLVAVAGDAPAEIVEEIRNLLSAEPIFWDINNPTVAKAGLIAELREKGRAIALLPRYHDAALRELARIARGRGSVPIAIIDEPGQAHFHFDNVGGFKSVFEGVPMPNDRRADEGPFDIIGDVHGCAREFMTLLERLGHADRGWEDAGPADWRAFIKPHADGRRAVLLGDLVDRGPHNYASLLIARQLVRFGGYLAVGNHDDKVARWLMGREVVMKGAIVETAKELGNLSVAHRTELGRWILSNERHYILDQGRLVVAHAGLAEHLHGRRTKEADAFATYGLTDPDAPKDPDGYPARIDWAHDYSGDAFVVHGHVVYDDVRIKNRVISIDTGCVFGGKLTALQWPEQVITSVDAEKTYVEGQFASASEGLPPTRWARLRQLIGLRS